VARTGLLAGASGGVGALIATNGQEKILSARWLALQFFDPTALIAAATESSE
jgi:hypothetical protein